MSFKRTIEDFVCEHCGGNVEGNGYTDHCPFCLWSKHVDIDPGDREAECGGMMEPWDIEPKSSEFRVINKCMKCGFMRPSPITIHDDVKVFSDLVRTVAKRKKDSLR